MIHVTISYAIFLKKPRVDRQPSFLMDSSKEDEASQDLDITEDCIEEKCLQMSCETLSWLLLSPSFGIVALSVVKHFCWVNSK